jgi:hydrogenase maturation protease
MNRVSILGIGNVLMGDDAAGPYAIAVLTAKYEFPDNVAVMDVGTPGLDLAPFLSGADTLIIIDTVRSDAPPGSIRIYDKQTLLTKKLPPRLSPHDPALSQCLISLEMAGEGPREVILIGIVPKRLTFGPGLSDEVQVAIPDALARTLGELAVRNIFPARRVPAAEPDLWWEAPVCLMVG